jgi:hypothetical protein
MAAKTILAPFTARCFESWPKLPNLVCSPRRAIVSAPADACRGGLV